MSVEGQAPFAFPTATTASSPLPLPDTLAITITAASSTPPSTPTVIDGRGANVVACLKIAIKSMIMVVIAVVTARLMLTTVAQLQHALCSGKLLTRPLQKASVSVSAPASL